MRVLVACEFSGIVRDAFAARGHDAWSCDLLPTERPGKHYQQDVLDACGVWPHLIHGDWDLMIAHPPCTYLTNAGVRHLHESVSSVNGKDRFAAMVKACTFFIMLKNAPIPKIAIENPTPHRYARELIGRYQQAIQPWEFGVPETKRTCLWLKNLPPLMATIIETVRYPRVHMTPPGKDRWKIRSITPQGIADAMAKQWG